MDLHIFDMSNYIYAGSFSHKSIGRGVRETNGEYQANEAPIGGVRFAIRQIASYIKEDTVVMPVFDRVPVIKRDMYANAFGSEDGYKGNRPPKKLDITQQQRYAEEIMRDMGMVVQAVEDYEADDVIYSLVQYYKNDFDHIYVHTKDSDLFFLVSENVSISTVGEQGKDINIYNYPTQVHSSEHTLYNTVHLRKLCRGDSSDNIPGVGWDFAEKIDSIVPTEEYNKFGDLDLCRSYILKTIRAYPMLDNAHRILSTFNIICPLLIPYEELNDVEEDIDREKLNYYLRDWDKSLDRWNLEDMLMEYIDTYYR